jgi:hypothetical protein
MEADVRRLFELTGEIKGRAQRSPKPPNPCHIFCGPVPFLASRRWRIRQLPHCVPPRTLPFCPRCSCPSHRSLEGKCPAKPRDIPFGREHQSRDPRDLPATLAPQRRLRDSPRRNRPRLRPAHPSSSHGPPHGFTAVQASTLAIAPAILSLGRSHDRDSASPWQIEIRLEFNGLAELCHPI